MSQLEQQGRDGRRLVCLPGREGTAGRNHPAQTVAAHRVHRGITCTLSLLPHRVAAGVEVGVNGIYLH